MLYSPGVAAHRVPSHGESEQQSYTLHPHSTCLEGKFSFPVVGLSSLACLGSSPV